MNRILIVDDHPENLYLLRAMLQGHGYEVDEARHGAEALVKARQSPPRLIISDLLMPVMDGYTLLRYWKTDDRLKQIPFVVYTATYTEPQDEQLALSLGADGFILKPTEPEPFMARIRTVLAASQLGRLTPTQGPTGEEKTRLKEYSEVLVRKLEDKALQLERANHELAADIAARQRAEAELREREEQLRLYAENSPAAVAMFDRDMKYLVASQRWLENNHLTGQSVVGRSHYEVVPDIPLRWREVHQRCLAGAIEKCDEDPFLRADGRTDWIRWEVRPWHQADGSIGGIILFYEDITGRKQAELHIQQLNRVFSVLSAINQAIVQEKDPQAMLESACRIAVEKGRFRLAWIGLLDPLSNQVKVAAQAGAAREYLAGLEITLADEPRGRGPTSEALRTGGHVVCNDIERDPRMTPWREKALRLGLRASVAFPLKVQDKIVGSFSLYADTAGFFDAEELRLLDELAMDISFALEVSEREQERRKAEDELRWKTAFFEAQVDSALDGILVVDSAGRKILQNQRLIELLKIPPHLADGKDDAAQLAFAARQVKHPGQFTEQVVHLYSHPDEVSRDEMEMVDGTILDRASAPVRDKAGKYYGRIWTFRDITDRRKLEAQFRQAQKMEAIGQLAGGVAHDFNNILAAIMMQADLAATGAELPEATREMLNEIRAATERAANLTRQLLAFSRRQVMQPRELDLNEIVTSLTKMLQRIVGEDVRLQLNLHPRPLIARADAGMLDQVLLNLVINARDAMPGGGRLFIETREKDFTEEEVALNPEASPGRHLCLRVTDTGCGIAPENLTRIFEPFFTTKAPGKGTGLGLATVFGIVKQHGGSLAVESEVGKGSTFQIFLPAARATGQAPDEMAVRPVPRGGTETILLVEDERSVRVLTRVVLERAGYQVLEAAHGVEALKLWGQHQGRIQMLLTDLVMPEGISGRELATRLLADNPRLRVVFTSGYSAEIAGRELSLQEGQNFIQKPAGPQQLLETVRRCLDD